MISYHNIITRSATTWLSHDYHMTSYHMVITPSTIITSHTCHLKSEFSSRVFWLSRHFWCPLSWASSELDGKCLWSEASLSPSSGSLLQREYEGLKNNSSPHCYGDCSWQQHSMSARSCVRIQGEITRFQCKNFKNVSIQSTYNCCIFFFLHFSKEFKLGTIAKCQLQRKFVKLLSRIIMEK